MTQAYKATCPVTTYYITAENGCTSSATYDGITVTLDDLSIGIGEDCDVIIKGLTRKPLVVPLYVLGDLRRMIAILSNAEPNMFERTTVSTKLFELT